jgi:hypothetical protein
MWWNSVRACHDGSSAERDSCGGSSRHVKVVGTRGLQMVKVLSGDGSGRGVFAKMYCSTHGRSKNPPATCYENAGNPNHEGEFKSTLHKT